MRNIKAFIRRKLNRFPGTEKYWEKRYEEGGNSGSGSYGRLALYKANFLKQFIDLNNVNSIVDLGCGDGNQLQQLNLSASFKYHGVDLSDVALQICRSKFKETSFLFSNYQDFKENFNLYEMALSMDVLFHIINEKDLYHYIDVLFSSATRYVIIYSSNVEYENRFHVRDRKFTPIVEKKIKNWKLIFEEKNPYPYDLNNAEATSRSNFYVYEKLS